MRLCKKCQAEIDMPSWTCPLCGWSAMRYDGLPLLSPELEQNYKNYSPETYDRLVRVEENSFWFSHRNRIIEYLVGRFFSNAQSFFEIGCGTGFVLNAIANRYPWMSLTGADVLVKGLKYARERVPHAEFLQMDAVSMPFDSEFDLIGVFDVLEHIDDALQALKAMNKAIKPGGGLLLTVPQHRWLWSKWDEAAGHQRRYSRKQLLSELRDAGFEVLSVTSIVTLLLPLMIVSRLVNRRKKEDDGKTQVGLRLPGWLNVALSAVCRIEGKAIKWGLSFPWGGSLVCVAVAKK